MSGPLELDRGLSFIHIPKNAGTSIRQAIVENQLPILLSDHAYPRQLTDQEIVVLRCPISRFVSAFYYGQTYWANPINGQFSDPNELAVSASDPDHPKYRTAWIELGNLPEHFQLRDGKATPPQTVASRATDMCWVYEPQTTWLANQPRHVLRYRHLAEDFAALIESLDLPGTVQLPISNRSRSGDARLSSQALAFLERTYASDFEFIRARGLEV